MDGSYFDTFTTFFIFLHFSDCSVSRGGMTWQHGGDWYDLASQHREIVEDKGRKQFYPKNEHFVADIATIKIEEQVYINSIEDKYCPSVRGESRVCTYKYTRWVCHGGPLTGLPASSPLKLRSCIAFLPSRNTTY